LTVVASGSLNEQVTSGELYIEVSFGPITVLNTTYSLCDMISAFGMTCPLNQGTLDIGIKELIPGDAPEGTYTGLVTLNDQNNQQILCIKLNFKMTAATRKIQFIN